MVRRSEGLGEEALGIRRGSAGPLVATGIRPGRIPPWSESASGLLERSVGGGGLVTSKFAKRCGLLTGCAGLGRGDPSQKEVRQWTAQV